MVAVVLTLASASVSTELASLTAANSRHCRRSCRRICRRRCRRQIRQLDSVDGSTASTIATVFSSSLTTDPPSPLSPDSSARLQRGHCPCSCRRSHCHCRQTRRLDCSEAVVEVVLTPASASMSTELASLTAANSCHCRSRCQRIRRQRCCRQIRQLDSVDRSTAGTISAGTSSDD